MHEVQGTFSDLSNGDGSDNVYRFTESWSRLSPRSEVLPAGGPKFRQDPGDNVDVLRMKHSPASLSQPCDTLESGIKKTVINRVSADN